MSDDRMEKDEQRLEAEIRDLLARADGDDEASGSERRGGPTGPAAGRVEVDVVGPRELPVHHTKATRAGSPQPSAQRNFTDPESRIMERQFTQAYNGHIAVDDEWHVIVGQGASNQAPDTESFIPILERVQDTVGQRPEKVTADAGLWSPENAGWAEHQGVDAYISTHRQRHGAPPKDPAEPSGPTPPPQQRMRHEVSTTEGRGLRAARAGGGVQTVLDAWVARARGE